jgi:signal transduction histidine kinase
MNEKYPVDVRFALASAVSDGEATLLSPLFAELWSARELDATPASVRMSSIDALAATFLARGVAPSTAVREVLAAGRALVETAEHDGQLDPAGARRLQVLVDEAAVRTAQAVEAARKVKRQQWLSFLVHELKNPLNTVLNAIWLLREKGSDPKQAARFLELAERAVKRLEARCRDVRELDEDLMNPPPGWEASQRQP